MLYQKISEDLKQSMKDKDVLRTSTLRMLLAAIRNKEIELLKKESGLAEEELLRVVRSELKKRKEAASEFERGGRAEMAEKEVLEAAILELYLPSELSDDELHVLVEEKMRELGVSAKANFGVAMKAVMAAVQGRATGERVAQAVKDALRG